MLRTKGCVIVDGAGEPIAEVVAIRTSKGNCRRWAQYVVDRVNADLRGAAIARQREKKDTPDSLAFFPSKEK